MTDKTSASPKCLKMLAQVGTFGGNAILQENPLKFSKVLVHAGNCGALETIRQRLTVS